MRLFDRNPREVSLTEEGRRFHTQVMPLLAGLDEAAAEAAGAAAVVRGRLRLSVDPWFARMVLASKLKQFLVRYPLYAYHPSRHLPPAKVRALLDFIQEIAVST